MKNIITVCVLGAVLLGNMTPAFAVTKKLRINFSTTTAATFADLDLIIARFMHGLLTGSK